MATMSHHLCIKFCFPNDLSMTMPIFLEFRMIYDLCVVSYRLIVSCCNHSFSDAAAEHILGFLDLGRLNSNVVGSGCDRSSLMVDDKTHCIA